MLCLRFGSDPETLKPILTVIKLTELQSSLCALSFHARVCPSQKVITYKRSYQSRLRQRLINCNHHSHSQFSMFSLEICATTLYAHSFKHNLIIALNWHMWIMSVMTLHDLQSLPAQGRRHCYALCVTFFNTYLRKPITSATALIKLRSLLLCDVLHFSNTLRATSYQNEDVPSSKERVTVSQIPPKFRD